MPKVKISEYSATANSNTDVASINIDEGCAPSGINNAIRAVMGHLKDFQQGTYGDPFNGPVNGTVGATTANTGAFTTLTTTGTINLLTVGRGAGAVATNTAVGASALAANTTGGFNTAVGSLALTTNTGAGEYNNAFGWQALKLNTTGNENQAFGISAMLSNTTGSNNTAMGSNALRSNTTASNNTAVGYQAGYSQTSSGANGTFLGYQAGYSSTSSSNCFVGYQAGYASTGVYNMFFGRSSGESMTTGSANVILGRYSGNQGGLDIRTASNYIVLSDGDGNPRLIINGSTGYFQTGLGASSPYNATTASAANVNIFSDGALYRSTSALKYKQDIRDIESIDINLLRGVRYKSKCKGDDQTKDYFGIVADEVDAAGIKELVSYGAEGEVEGFQYERLTVVLLKKLQTLDAEFKAYVATHP